MPDTLNIAVIEDDLDARSGLVDILELDNHRVTAFSTVAAAIEYGFVAVDVILMDRKLPDGMAEELLPRLRSLAKGSDVIIITGYADMNATIAAMREGVCDYLIKPIDPTALGTSLTRIARRRAMERELYRQRRFAEQLLETAEAIVLVLNAQGRVLRVNRFFLSLTGYSLDEVLGQDWFDRFIPSRERKDIRQTHERTVKQLSTRGIVNPIVTKDGIEKYIRWSNSTLRDSQGQTTAVLAVGLDVTEFVEAQKEMLQTERLATIGETVTGLAHESRNALQRMQNAVDLLKISLTDPMQLKDLEKIERSGQHIRGLLHEVRNYAAPVQLALREESLRNIWRRAWESVSHRVADREVGFEESLSEGATWDDLRLNVDNDRMEQVFRNLFENALDAKEECLNIQVECSVSHEVLRLVVRDNGPGVPESHRGKLFDAFATSKPKGTGLGLSICKRIVEAHDGTLRLLGTKDGAAFELSIPRSGTKAANRNSVD